MSLGVKVGIELLLQRDSHSEAHDMETTCRMLLVSIGIDQFAVPLTSIQEVAVVSNITRIPDDNEIFQGKMKLRNDLINVFKIGKVLGFEYDEGISKKMMLICQSQNQLVGAVVDTIHEVIEMSDDIINSAEHNNAGYFTIIKDDAPLNIVNLEKIMNRIEIRNLEKRETDG